MRRLRIIAVSAALLTLAAGSPLPASADSHGVRPGDPGFLLHDEDEEEVEECTDLHVILGGIGYIVGLTGIAFYLLARRRLRAAGQGMVG